MKKIVCFLLCLMMALALCPGIMAEDAASIPKLVLSDKDFPHTISTNSTGQRTFQFDSGLIAPEYGGVIETLVLPGDEETRGTSLKIGLEQESASLPSLNIPITSFYDGGEGELTLDYDLYIGEMPAQASGNLNGSAIRFCFYGANSDTMLYWVKRDDGKHLRAYANGASGYGQFHEFTEKSWYKLRLKLAWQAVGGTYDYHYSMYYAPYADGSGVCEDDSLIPILEDVSISGVKQVTQLRLYCPRLASTAETWFAVDNVKVTQPAAPPDIDGLGYITEDGAVRLADKDGEIPHTAQKLIVRLNDPVYRVNEGDVILTRNGVPLAGGETVYDNENKWIVLTLAEPLEESASYRITLSENIEVYEGVYLQVPRSADFSVPEGNLQVTLLNDGDFAVSETNETDTAGRYMILENGATAYDGAGYSKISASVPGGDGNSLVIGMGANEGDTRLPRAVIELAELESYRAQKLTFDFKVYISEKTHNADGNNFRLMLYGNKSVPALTLGGTLKTGSVNQAYTAGEWHTVSLAVRWTESGAGGYEYYYDLTWDGELLAENIAADAALTSLTALRFYAPYNPEYQEFMAIDDLVLRVEKPRPDIMGFGADGEMKADGVIDYRSEIVEVYLTDAIHSVTADQVQLCHNGLPVALSGVGWDSGAGCILLRVQEPLSPNASYEVTLADSIEAMPGVALGRVRSGGFTTATEAVNITDVSVTEKAESIQITAQAANTQQSEQTVCLLATLWRGKDFLGTRVARGILGGGEKQTLSLEIADLQSGDMIEISGWDSLTGVKLFTRGITYHEVLSKK